MLRDALILLRKDLRNVFRDRRAIFANYLLPLLIMPLLFGALGFFQARQAEERATKIYRVSIENAPDATFGDILSSLLRFHPPPVDLDADEALRVVFPSDFAPGDRGTVLLYANSNSSDQEYAARMIRSALLEYENLLSSEKLGSVGLTLNDLDSLETRFVDTAPARAQGASVIGVLLPYMLVLYLFAGSMAMGIDTTAGEKERGSLTSLLVNQVSRTSIAVGKILFVVTSALINSTATFVGLLVAFRLNASVFGLSEFGGLTVLTPLGVVSLLLMLLTGSGIAASVVVLLGSMARNLKEATGYIMPVYIVVIITGVATMNMDTAKSIGPFFIPVVNVIFSLKGIILSQITVLQLLVTLFIDIGLVVGIAYVTSRLYNTERILNTVA